MQRGVFHTLWLVVAITLICSPVHAEFFQIVDPRTGYYLSYSLVYLDGQPMGRTDKYGRISIEFQHGTHLLEIRFRNTVRRAQVEIDGSGSLKVVQPE